MIVTWPGHAQLFLNAADKTLLLDPWFAEPVFGGAWFRYPPAPLHNASMFPRPDFVLLSHTHPDHSGLETLAQLQKDQRIVVAPFPSGAMTRRLARAGLANVQWLEPWRTETLAPGLKVTFVPHHAGWEVASIIVEADGVRLYHGNDNPLSIEAYREVVARLGPIDLAFLPYAGASSYPTGFDGDEATLHERCEKKKREGLQRFTEGLEGLRPAEAVPFASSWALLEMSEVHKNFVDRFTADQVLSQAIEKAASTGTHLLHMSPGDEWTRETGVLRMGLTEGWTNDVAAVRRYAEQEKARVDAAIARTRSPGKSVPAESLDRAMHAYFSELLRHTSAATSQLSMRAGFVAEGEGGGAWRVHFTPGAAPTFERGLLGDEHEVLRLPAPELATIVLGPANWEDVWYGYRLRVSKAPGAGYYRAFWDALLTFDDDALSTRLRAELL
ncbi:MAG: MBL fold metallo-hydrolase [Archangium sp.]|nr:MBL fold metallo-hydrolase [Archangium sp.]